MVMENVRNAMVKDSLNANDAKAMANVHVVMVEAISIAKNVEAKEKSEKIMNMETHRNKMCLDIKPRAIDSLIDWSTHPDKSIANYSGKAVYTTDFNLPELPEGQTFLDLGKVMVMAKVKINGKYAGGAWTSPYRVNVTELLTEGKNTLEIEVVNTWRNRLIGDAALTPESRVTWTNFELVRPDEPLQSSGLIGPVRIITYN